MLHIWVFQMTLIFFYSKVTAVGRFDQSQTLLDIVKTKDQGYEALIKALISCNQSGAFNILLDGFPHERFLNLKLNLGRYQIFLRDLLNETKISSILAKLKIFLSPLSYLNFCLQTNIDQYSLNLLRDTIPSQLDAYKNRYLLSRRIGDRFYNNTLGERTFGKAFPNEIIDISIEGMYIYTVNRVLESLHYLLKFVIFYPKSFPKELYHLFTYQRS